MQRRRVSFKVLITAVLSAMLAVVPLHAATAAPPGDSPSHFEDSRWQYRLPYDFQVLHDRPVGYWPQLTSQAFWALNLVGSAHGTIHGDPGVTSLPNGDHALTFDGVEDYVEVPDDASLSPATTGTLTVEAWLRPDVLAFPNDEKAGYVHWMGKGEPDQHEWVSRMYSLDNTVQRENRISGYLFNIDGGLGAGSYYQQPIKAGQWLHYVLIINSEESNEDYPAGYTKLFIDGELVDQDSLIYDGVEMEATRGTAPMRIGTRDFGSFFEGAVGKIATYDYELPPDRITAHLEAMHQ